MRARCRRRRCPQSSLLLWCRGRTHKAAAQRRCGQDNADQQRAHRRLVLGLRVRVRRWRQPGSERVGRQRHDMFNNARGKTRCGGNTAHRGDLARVIAAASKQASIRDGMGARTDCCGPVVLRLPRRRGAQQQRPRRVPESFRKVPVAPLGPPEQQRERHDCVRDRNEEVAAGQAHPLDSSEARAPRLHHDGADALCVRLRARRTRRTPQ